ncbi:unnamed protein product [Symbiodinium sp. KB8]|nr:unnamed protein product [Symbiodinium sp. KB8]
MAEVMGPPPDLRWLLPPPSLLPGPVPPAPPHPAAATAHPHAMVLARRDRAAQTQGLQRAVAAFLEHVQAEHPDAAAGMAAVLAALGLPSAAPAPTSGRPGSKKGGRGGGDADSTGRGAEGVAAWQPPSSPGTGGDAWSHSAAGSAEGGPTTAPWRRYAEDDPMAALEPWAHPAPELGPPLSPWYAVWLQCNGGVPPAAVVGSTATDSVPAPGKREVQALAPIRSVPTVPGTPAAALAQRWRATGVVVDGLRLALPGETASGGGDIVAPPPALGQAPQPELGSGGPTPHGSLTRPGGSFMALSANGAQVLEPPLAPGGVSLVGAVAVSTLEPLPEGVGEVPAQSMTGPASGAGAPPAGWGSPPTAGFAPGSITLVDAPDPLLPLDAAGGPTLRREAYAGTPGLNCLAMAPGTPPAPWLVTPAHPGPSRPHLDWAAGWGSDVAAVLGSGDTAAVGQGVLPPATAAWLEGGEEGAVEAPSNPLPNPLQAPAEDGARSGRAKTPPSRGSGRGAAKSSKASDLPPAPTPPVSRRAVSLADLPPALAALLQPAEPLSGGLGSTAPGGRGPGPAADLGALALPPLGPPACVPPCSGSASGVPGEVPLGAPAPGWAAAVPSLPLLPAGRAEDVLSDDSESDAEEDAAMGGAGTRATPRTRPSPMPSLAQAVQSFGGIPGLQLPPDVEVGSIAPLAKRRGGGSGGAAEPAAPPPLPALRGSDVLRCPAEQLTPQNLQRLLAPLEDGAPWCQQAQPSPRKHTQDMSSASPLVCEGEGAAAGWPLSLRWLAAGVLLARLQARNAPVAAQPSSADSEHSDLQRALQTLVELPESASTPTSSADLAAAMAVLVKVAALPQGPAVRATRFAKDGSLQPDPSVPPAPQAFVQAVLAFQSAAVQAMRFDAAASACLGKPAAVPPPLGACLPDDLLAQASRDMLEAALTGSAPEPALPPPVDWAERVLATDELRNLDAACRLGGSWCAPDSQGSTGAVTRAASTFRQWVLGGEAPAESPLPQPLPALGLPEGLAVEAVDAPVAAAAATP